jgi:chromosomal replication initiator protein
MDDQDAILLKGMLAHLRATHPVLCRQWFEELVYVGVGGGALELRASSPIHRDYLKRQCADAFNDALRTVSGRLLSVRFLGPDDAATAPPPAPPKRTARDPVTPRPVAAGESVLSDPGDDITGEAALLRGHVPPAHEAAWPAEPPSASITSTQPPAPSQPLAQPSAQPPTHVASQAAQTNTPNGVTSAHDAPPHMPQVVVRPGAMPPRKPSLVQIGDPSRGGYESLTINPDYSFENFVPGPENRLAHAAALAVAAQPGHAYNPFFVHGGIGLGKSHLLQAICLRIAESAPQCRMYYISCEGFFTQFIESVQNGQMSDFRHRYRDVDLLVIDDIHYLANRDRTQEEFFHTFNSLYQANRQIILSSDAAPEEIPNLEERLVSRFKWGLVAKVEPPSYETRLAILQSKARLRNLVLPEEAAKYLAERVQRNVRELEGAIIKLQIQSTVEQRPIDVEMAKAAMGEPPKTTTVEPSMQAIIAVVTEFYRIRLADLQSKHRQRSITLPRQVCMFLARKLTRHSLEEIGGFFGGRDHTTVMHALRIIEARRKEDGEFDATVVDLEARCRGTQL